MVGRMRDLMGQKDRDGRKDGEADGDAEVYYGGRRKRTYMEVSMDGIGRNTEIGVDIKLRRSVQGK